MQHLHPVCPQTVFYPERRVSVLSRVLLVLALLLFVRCSAITEPFGRPRQTILEAVSGDALLFLGPDGRFRLPSPEPDGVPILAADTARLLVEWIAHNLDPLAEARLEADRRRPIEFARLRACGPSYYAHSQFNFSEIPIGIPEDFEFFYGPYWVIALCDNTGPAASIAVAGHSLPKHLAGDGWLFPFNSTYQVGIPREWTGGLPATAEAAVLLVARASGRRVVSLPIFYTPNPGYGTPQGGLWAITMDREATFIGTVSGRRITTNRVFVGSLPDTDPFRRGPVHLFLEAANGRRMLTIDPRPFGPVFNIAVKPGTAIDFEPVNVVP